MINNLNTQEYWDHRFSSGDWEESNGRKQTKYFAMSLIKHLKIQKDFTGSILDYGCGLGDAIPVYKLYFPKAKLYGVDISSTMLTTAKKLHQDNQRMIF